MIVVPLARQAARKALVVDAGMVRERKLETIGEVILAPDQRPGGRIGGSVEGEIGRGCMSSRLGSSGVFGEGMMVLTRGAG